jgi:HTH-type transcriptional regulator / antitoxin HigA
MELFDNDNQFKDIDKLLSGALKKPVSQTAITLRERFEKRAEELNISPTAALDILNIEYRALHGILNGTQKNVDFTALSKIARFLGITYPEVIELYLRNLDANFQNEIGYTDKGKFILENFDLAILKRAKVIDSINNIELVEKQLLSILGLKDIFDYKRDKIDAAFSSGKSEPKNTQTRDLWMWYASSELELYNNHNEYNKQTLIDYFPQIRWHSRNVEKGLYEVIRTLYRLGITVIFQPSLPTLNLRGATFSVHDKPCIVLTDYKGYYPTLWFALIHELFHVLFDWEEIRVKKYHLSLEDDDLSYGLKLREEEANRFAREYLFSDKKLEAIKMNLNDDFFIEAVAKKNNVDPSIIYAFHAFDRGKSDPRIWGKVSKKFPDVLISLRPLYYYEWEERKGFDEIARIRKRTIFTDLNNKDVKQEAQV